MLTRFDSISADIANAVIASGLFPNPNTGNETLDIFNVTGRVSTDGQFRYVDIAGPVHLVLVDRLFD